MARYRFLTTWTIQAPIADVADAIIDATRWPEWWPGVLRVDRLAQGAPDGVGDRHEISIRSALPYTLTLVSTTTAINRPTLFEGAAAGELAGTGRWDLEELDGVTTARYTWEVDTTKPWMNALAPLLRPLFVWNHHVVMRRGAEGLARLLDARLIAVDSTPRAVRPAIAAPTLVVGGLVAGAIARRRRAAR